MLHALGARVCSYFTIGNIIQKLQRIVLVSPLQPFNSQFLTQFFFSCCSFLQNIIQNRLPSHCSCLDPLLLADIERHCCCCCHRHCHCHGCFIGPFCFVFLDTTTILSNFHNITKTVPFSCATNICFSCNVGGSQKVCLNGEL